MTPKQLAEEIEKASTAFTEMTLERHEAGGEKYGPLNFLEVNTVEEAMYELADLANYARYTFIKLWLLNNFADAQLEAAEINVGAHAFEPRGSGGGG